MKSVIRPVLLSLLLAPTNAHLLLSQDDYATPILAGISNQGQNKGQPYVTAGDRTYLIGTQDGNFPDLGDHVPGEMGGLWLHPIKLIDGFWATVTDLATNQDVALSESTEFVNYPYGNRFRYGLVLDSLEIERFQFSPDGQQGLIVQYSFKNAADRKRQLRFQFLVKTDLIPVWLSDRLGIKDAPDTLTWQTAHSLFIARDTELADQSRPIRDRLASTFAAWSRPIETCIRDAQKAGEISRDIDPSALVDFLLNSFEGAMLRMKVEKDSSPLDHFMTLVFSRVLT